MSLIYCDIKRHPQQVATYCSAYSIANSHSTNLLCQSTSASATGKIPVKLIQLTYTYSILPVNVTHKFISMYISLPLQLLCILNVAT